MNIFGKLFEKSNQKLSNDKLLAVFNRFVGAEVPGSEEYHPGDTMFGLNEPGYYYTRIDINSPICKAMGKVARDTSAYVHFIENSCDEVKIGHRHDHRKNCVAAHVEKVAQGKYRIKHFDVG